MGQCKFCAKPAGFLRRGHSECRHIHDEGINSIRALTSKTISSEDLLDSLLPAVQTIAGRSYVSANEIQASLLQSWFEAVDHFLEDGVLDEGEEKRIVQFKDRFSFSQSELDKTGALTRVVKAGTIREVLHGTIPKRIALDSTLSINFQKGEQVVWAFPQSPYFEDKTRREYVGSSMGVSVRVAKGLYLRSSAFKGHPVDRTERVQVDTGAVVVTNKNIYFAGPNKSFRVPYAKIVSFQPFTDGVGIIRDAANAKPQIFITGDGWFTYNLVTNLAKL